MRDLDCTVLVFTYERPYHLSRAISYWEKSSIKVIIADGSKYAHNNIPDSIEYLHRPGVSVTERILELANNVKTKFAVFAADDDFLGYEGLEQSIKFLDDNQGYSSAQGLYTQFRISKYSSKIITRPGNYCYANQYTWDDDNYANRLESINKYKIMHYCYSVVTRDVLDSLCNLYSGIKDFSGSTLFEPLMAYSIAINGKVKTLKYFYCAREVVESPDWLGIASFEGFIENNTPEYRKFVGNVANECVNKHGEDRQKAVVVAEKAGHTFVSAMIKREKILKHNNISNEAHTYSDKVRHVIRSLIIYIKILFQELGVTSEKGLNKNYFFGDAGALSMYKRDWKRIKDCIKSSIKNDVPIR